MKHWFQDFYNKAKYDGGFWFFSIILAGALLFGICYLLALNECLGLVILVITMLFFIWKIAQGIANNIKEGNGSR